MKEYRLETDTKETSLQRLEKILDHTPAFLKQIPEPEFSQKPAPDKWSKKEIIGHLIDSATNNHHRFVRGQFEDKPRISYDQDLWNKHSYYSVRDRDQLVSFWEMYNRHLADIIRHTPATLLERECLMGDGSIYTIAWLFDDYVRHLEHHLRQIFGQVPDGERYE